jgi:hypothetical protein
VRAWRQALAAAVALASIAAAPAPPAGLQLSLDPARWSTYANGSAMERFALASSGGALAFAFPRDAPPLFTADGRSPTAPSADYLFTDAVPSLEQAHALNAAFSVSTTPGAVFNARFEASNTCPGGPTVRLLLARRGRLTDALGATLPYTRWYSAPIALTPGPHALAVPLTGDAWTDVFGHRGDAATPPPGQSGAPADGFRAALAAPRVGLVFGGGCFAGHGVGVLGGEATFTLTSYASVP